MNKALYLRLLDLNNKRLRAVDSLCRNDQVAKQNEFHNKGNLNFKTHSYLLFDCDEDLDGIRPIAQIMLTHVDSFFLNDLLLLLLIQTCSITAPGRIAIASVASLLGNKRLAITLSASLSLLDDEVGWATKVSIHGIGVLFFAPNLIWELTDIVQKLASLKIFFCPPCHVVVRLSAL